MNREKKERKEKKERDREREGGIDKGSKEGRKKTIDQYPSLQYKHIQAKYQQIELKISENNYIS